MRKNNASLEVDTSQPSPIKNRALQGLVNLFLYVGALPFLLLLAMLIFSTITENFMTRQNLMSVSRQSTYLMMVSMGQMIVLLTAGLDLSVGVMIAMCSVTSSIVMVSMWSGVGPGWDAIILGSLAGLSASIAIGVINGIGVAYLRVAPFVMTLAMSSIVFGMALTITGGAPIYGMPEAFANTIGYGSFLEVPISVWITVFVIGFMYLLMSWTPRVFHSLPILILANQPDAEFHCQRLFGNEVAFVPYVMPGYDLSVAAASIQEENPNCKGLFLQNHGLFTFADTAEESYRFTIEYTNRADQYITDMGARLASHIVPDADAQNSDLTERITHALKTLFPDAVDLSLDYREEDNVRQYTSHSALNDLSRRGTVTPDHVIRTKPFPMICDEDESKNQLVKKIEIFIRDYQAYFDRHAPYASEPKTMLSPIPKVVVVKNKEIYGIDKSQKAAAIVADLAVQTARAVITSEQLCRFQPISEKDLFSMEYWSLEQAKLGGNGPVTF